jgi:hypothetical protein
MLKELRSFVSLRMTKGLFAFHDSLFTIRYSLKIVYHTDIRARRGIGWIVLVEALSV